MAESPINSSDTRDHLVDLVAHFAPYDGDFSTDISELTVYRRSAVSAPKPCIYGLGVTVALQGRKRLAIGGETIDYGDGDSVLTTLDLPGVSHIYEASESKPYLGLLLTLDPKLIAQICADMSLFLSERKKPHSAVSCHRLDGSLRNAIFRLVASLKEPQALRTQIAPLIYREICVRLLASDHGAELQDMVSAGSAMQQIASAITWIKKNFHTPISIEFLATQANMSASTFRLHFRAICGMSPLQYIKQIRLQEARHILWSCKSDAGEVAYRVGYESASQFTREYKRLFGNPPMRDLKLRQEKPELA